MAKKVAILKGTARGEVLRAKVAVLRANSKAKPSQAAGSSDMHVDPDEPDWQMANGKWFDNAAGNNDGHNADNEAKNENDDADDAVSQTRIQMELTAVTWQDWIDLDVMWREIGRQAIARSSRESLSEHDMFLMNIMMTRLGD